MFPMETAMQVRFPKWDFSRVRPHWAPNREFAQMQNAASTVPAYIEPYLVKVMLQAQAALDLKHEKLHKDLAVFIKQEMQHCKQHIAFNKTLRASGYEGMLPIEQAYQKDYEDFLAKKSLRFNCAYSEGFEAMSAVAVSVFFEEYDEFFEGADPDAVDLWKWHLAEEFEHREVAHDVYHTLFGRGVLAYLYRIYGLIYAMKHIRAHVRKVQDYLLSKDREGMNAAELAESKVREARVAAATRRRAREHLKQMFSPSYQPAHRVAPRGVDDYLRRFERRPAAAVAA